MRFFITLEGPDGGGKSTQARMLADFLRARGEEVVLTREPGGTKIGDQIRTILHSLANAEMERTTELLLYNAARAQIVAEVIRPGLAAGKIVISDRYAASTIAYQGYGRQIDLAQVRAIIEIATGGLKPDLSFLIDVPIDVGLARRQNGQQRHGEEWNRMDALAREFHERVRRGYAELIRAEPASWARIDGAQGMERVQGELCAQVIQAMERSQTETPTRR